MGYTDAQGRPEIVAQAFIKTGEADYRITETAESAAEGEAGSDRDAPSDAN